MGVSGLAIAACGDGASDGPSKGGGGTGGVILDCSTLPDPPSDCDKSCASDSQCEASFCDNGRCTAHCTATEGCGAGSSCNLRGRCVPEIGTGGTGGSGNTGGNGCQSVRVTPTRSIPNVMFLVDQSLSMDDDDFGPNNANRWTAAHDAITSIISATESIVRFGLTTYTSDHGNQNPPCPRLPTQVGFALDNAGPIASEYPASYPSEDGAYTPTGDSINSLVSLIQATPPPAEGPTIIVLATDGEPNSCLYPNPGDHAQYSRDLAVSAAANAHTAGMDLFVLWVGELTSSGTRNHIQQVANAGVGQTSGNAQFWEGTDPQDLENEFRDIVGASISCEVQIDKPFDDVQLACQQGDVRLNGTPLDCPSDWRVKPGVDNVIELVGSACQTFKSGLSTFTAEFPCGAILVE